VSVSPDSAQQVFVSSELAPDDLEVGVDLDRWRDLAAAALETEHSGSGELNLVFVGESAMADLNSEHMGMEGPTDVLAFPIDGESPADQGDLPVLLGDVVICPAVARRYASDHEVSHDDELALLVVHGVLHVLGHDHGEATESERMKARERELLAMHHRP
jgi:probable rRNA maturation factor